LSTPEWDQIIADLHSSEDVDRAVAASEALDRTADESWLPRLHSLLADGRDFFIREAAAAPIARIEGVLALPLLLNAMRRGEEEGHDNDGLCALISDLIGADPKRSAPMLLQMIDDVSERNRRDAAWLLGFVAEAITPEPLLTALCDSSPGVRAAATGSLSTFKGRPEVLDGLVRALADSEAEVRIAAASALGYLGDRRAETALREALADPAERVRFFARYALNQIKG
jgi:HEAT repeat protein